MIFAKVEEVVPRFEDMKVTGVSMRQRRTSGAFVIVLVLVMVGKGEFLVEPAIGASNVAVARGRMLEVLTDVAALVKDNYYDPTLKGLDWKASVEVARQRIRKADHQGEMVAAISGLLTRLNDSHTYFAPPDRLQPVIFGFRAKAFGEEVRVFQLMPNGPAEAAGLLVGDRIIGIEDFAATRKLIDDELRYFVYLDPRLTLSLRVARGQEPPRQIVINGRQPDSSSKSFRKEYEAYEKGEEKESFEGKVILYDNGELAYVRFPTFMVPGSEVDSFLKKAKDSRAVVLDLRDDGGGREDTMKEMAGHFLTEQTQMAVAISRNKREDVIAKPKKPNLSLPLFVLMDSRSASASEMFARILQMKHRAMLVGDRSAGKVNRSQFFGGLGGAIWSIPYGVAITISKAVMPDGQELENRGVDPDVSCVPSETELRSGRDPCLAKALALAREAISASAWSLLPNHRSY